MILSHQKFDFKESCLIEKVSIQAPFRMAVDFPEEACFIHFEAGSALVNSPFEQVSIGSEESVLLKCGSYFTDFQPLKTTDRYEIIVVHLPKNVLKEIYQFEMPTLASSSKKTIDKVTADHLVKEFIKGLHFYFDNPEVVSDELLALKIRELVLLLVQTKNAESVQVLFEQLFAPQQVDIRSVVNGHLFSLLSLEDLASLCHLSLSTFKRQFRNIYNDTPANYFKNKRLERAKELLRLSQLSISEIAFQTCFTDVAHFSKSFKMVYGESPTLYRVRNL